MNKEVTSNKCNPDKCPFCPDGICTFECASAYMHYIFGVSLDDKELNNIDSSKSEQKGEYYE